MKSRWYPAPRTAMNKIAEYNVRLLKYHEAHPEVSIGRLGKLFGITKQRVWQIIKRDKHDCMVVEYFRSYPETTPAEVSSIFHTSLQRAHSLSEQISPHPVPNPAYNVRLRVRYKPTPRPITTSENAPITIASILL